MSTADLLALRADLERRLRLDSFAYPPSGRLDDAAWSLVNYPESTWRRGKPRVRELDWYADPGEPWPLLPSPRSDQPYLPTPNVWNGTIRPRARTQIVAAEWPLFTGRTTVKVRVRVDREIDTPPDMVTVGLAVDGEVVEEIVREAANPPTDWAAVARGIFSPPGDGAARFNFTRTLELPEASRIELVNLTTERRWARGKITFTEEPL